MVTIVIQHNFLELNLLFELHLQFNVIDKLNLAFILQSSLEFKAPDAKNEKKTKTI